MTGTPRQRAVRMLLLASACSPWACGSRYVDIIAQSDAQSDAETDAQPDAQTDPCVSLDLSQCAADTQDNCSVQPNPTGCTSTNPSCGAGTCAGVDPFVHASGEGLFLRGKPFTFVGTVSYGIAWADNGCQISGYPSQQAALGPTFDALAAMHTSVLRFWAFQSFAGASGTDYSHFDRVVAAARAAGVRLLPVLENTRAESCSFSDTKDDAWFGGGYKSPYGSYTLSYRDYVTGVVTHFRNEPTIMAWELMHEAGGSQFSALDGFADDMTTLIRSNDSNHLIALGINDGDTPATSSDGEPSNYFKLQNRDGIDLVDVHDFDSPDQPLTAQEMRCQVIADELRKVIFVGAAGVKLADTSGPSFTHRGAQVASKLDAALAGPFRGFLVYDYVPNWATATYDFDSRTGEPLAGPNGLLDQRAIEY